MNKDLSGQQQQQHKFFEQENEDIADKQQKANEWIQNNYHNLLKNKLSTCPDGLSSIICQKINAIQQAQQSAQLIPQQMIAPLQGLQQCSPSSAQSLQQIPSRFFKDQQQHQFLGHQMIIEQLQQQQNVQSLKNKIAKETDQDHLKQPQGNDKLLHSTQNPSLNHFRHRLINVVGNQTGSQEGTFENSNEMVYSVETNNISNNNQANSNANNNQLLNSCNQCFHSSIEQQQLPLNNQHNSDQQHIFTGNINNNNNNLRYYEQGVPELQIDGANLQDTQILSPLFQSSCSNNNNNTNIGLFRSKKATALQRTLSTSNFLNHPSIASVQIPVSQFLGQKVSSPLNQLRTHLYQIPSAQIDGNSYPKEPLAENDSANLENIKVFIQNTIQKEMAIALSKYMNQDEKQTTSIISAESKQKQQLPNLRLDLISPQYRDNNNNECQATNRANISDFLKRENQHIQAKNIESSSSHEKISSLESVTECDVQMRLNGLEQKVNQMSEFYEQLNAKVCEIVSSTEHLVELNEYFQQERIEKVREETSQVEEIKRACSRLDKKQEAFERGEQEKREEQMVQIDKTMSEYSELVEEYSTQLNKKYKQLKKSSAAMKTEIQAFVEESLDSIRTETASEIEKKILQLERTLNISGGFKAYLSTLQEKLDGIELAIQNRDSKRPVSSIRQEDGRCTVGAANTLAQKHGERVRVECFQSEKENISSSQSPRQLYNSSLPQFSKVPGSTDDVESRRLENRPLIRSDLSGTRSPPQLCNNLVIRPAVSEKFLQQQFSEKQGSYSPEETFFRKGDGRSLYLDQQLQKTNTQPLSEQQQPPFQELARSLNHSPNNNRRRRPQKSIHFK